MILISMTYRFNISNNIEWQYVFNSITKVKSIVSLTNEFFEKELNSLKAILKKKFWLEIKFELYNNTPNKKWDFQIYKDYDTQIGWWYFYVWEDHELKEI